MQNKLKSRFGIGGFWAPLIVLLFQVSLAWSGEDAGIDPYVPKGKITKGWMRELPVTPVKRSIQYLKTEDAARFNPKEGELVFANFEHLGNLYIAVVDPEAVKNATFQIEPFGNLPTHTHSNLRFTLKDGHEVKLYPQTANSSAKDKPILLKDLIISDEGFSPAGGPWIPGAGLINDEFALAYRVKSVDDVLYQTYIAEGLEHIYQFPLCMEQDTCSTLLKNNLEESNIKGLNETYHLLTRNCTSELFRQIDAVTALSPIAKARAWIGNFGKWIPGWSKQALACRGLLDKKAMDSIENLEDEQVQTLNLMRKEYEGKKAIPFAVQRAEKAAEAAKKQKRVMLIWLSVGQGHKSAAEGIAERIRAADPTAEVVLKDIADFAKNPVAEKAETWLYWQLVKKAPDKFDALYRSTMKKGRNIPHMDDLPSNYDPEKLNKFIHDGKFDTVVSTYYGGAQLTGKLAEEGKLDGIKTGWLHTDYFTGYFPRISQRVNKSFVPERSLEDVWNKWGVKPDAVTTTGMPFPNTLYEPVDKTKFFAEMNEKYLKAANGKPYLPLDPKVKTVTITGGGEGVGDFPGYVRSLAANAKEDLQIITVAAKNEKHIEALNKMIESGELERLSKHKINLKVLGYTPLPEVLNFIKSSDVYVTKSGGLSPAEGFVIGRPMVITDVYGGHEKDNAKLFEDLGMGLVNRDADEMGKQVNRIFEDESLRKSMEQAQQKFRNDVNMQKVVDFVFDKNTPLVHPEQQFAVGELETTDKALRQLDFDAPSDVEVIMPMNQGHEKEFTVRVGDQVYAYDPQNGGSVKKIALRDFLYGVESADGKKQLTGISYLQDAASVRIRNVEPKYQAALIKALEDTSAKSQDAFTHVIRALKESGMRLDAATKKPDKNPSKFFGQLAKAAQDNPYYGVDLINYAQVHSPADPGLSWRRQTLKEPATKAPVTFTKRLATYVANPGLVYENMNDSSITAIAERTEELASRYRNASDQLTLKENETEAFIRSLEKQNLSAKGLDQAYEKLSRSLAPEQLKLVAAKKIDALPERERQKAQEYLAFQKKVDTALTEKMKRVDDLTQAKLDHVIDESMDMTRLMKAELLTTLTSDAQKPMEELLTQMETQYQLYKELRGNYGLPKDGQTRMHFFKKYFESLSKFHDQINRLKVESLPESKKPILRAVKEMLAKIITTIKTVADFAPDLAGLFRAAFLPKAPKPGEIDFTKTVNESFRNLARKKGITVSVEGKDLIPPLSADGKTVNIYTPTHRMPMNDAMIMSHIMPDDSLIFAQELEVLGGKIDKKVNHALNKTNGWIMVGWGRDKPINEALAQMKKTGSRNLWIYPEGSVSTGIGETRPPRQKFSYGLLKKLMEEGYNLNLIPVTYENSDRLLHLEDFGDEEGEKVLRAKISHHVSNDKLKTILSQGDDQAINRYLRSVWMENLPTNEETLFGQWRVKSLERRIPERLRVGRPEVPYLVDPERCLKLFEGLLR